mgnify:CR=1 FL=1
MTITPLKNTLSKKFSSKNVVLYSGCCCCCCCCVLAPVGSYITEKIINKKYPERGNVWKHVFVNFAIVLIAVSLLLTVVFGTGFTFGALFGALLSDVFHSPIIGLGAIGLVGFVLMYILFYLYSFRWFNRELGKNTRLKAVFWETLLTVVFWVVLFGISIPVTFFVMSGLEGF